MSANETQDAAGAARETLTRSSERGAVTRAGLLAASREVFTSVGYMEAGVTGIVALSVIGRIDITSRG